MKFCFFGNVSGALKDQTPGGGELQVALLAKALALKGHEVVIIDPYSKESFVTEEGAKLIHIPTWNKGIRGLRLFTNRIPTLKRLFREQKADFYYVRMRHYLHLIPYLAARRNGGRFIQAIASEVDTLGFWGKFRHKYKTHFNPFKFFTLDLPNDIVFNYLVRKSDYIILQHSDQKLKVKSVKGKVVIFPNIFNFNKLPVVDKPSKDYYIQVGTINVVKGSESLYQLINEVDKKCMIMIVGQPIDRKSRKIYKHLGKVKNVTLKGRVKHSETMRLIANAKALINTSSFEGFPNIFLEAWATGVPVVSLNVNPEDIINKYQLGICCDGSLTKMKNCIESDETAGIDRQGLIRYVSEFHDFARAGDRFLNVINNAN